MACILLIDDDELLRKTLRRVLTSAGSHKVLEAENGAVASLLLEEEPVDLVVTDIFMPHQDGIKVIMEINEKYPDVKIIAISGGGRIESIDYLELAQNIGAHHVFKKPFDHREFVEKVGELLK